MDIAIRAVFLYLFLLFLMRVIGRRELSSLGPVDLVLLIVLGDAIQQGLTQDDYSLTGAVLAVGTIALLQVATSYVNFKFPRARAILDGEPLVIVQDGKFVKRNMDRERLTEADVVESARMESIGSIDEVAWAVIETSGQISFIKRS